MARPPSSQPAVCSTKLTPARQVGSKVLADSNAACASGIFEAHRLPPERNGTPRRRASAAMEYSTSAGSGCAEGRGARLHGDRRGEAAEHHWRAGIDQLHEREAGQRLGQGLRHGARHRHRRHGSGQNEWRDDQGLIGARIDFRGAEHGRVVGHRRIDVDQIDDGRLRPSGQRIVQFIRRTRYSPSRRNLRHAQARLPNP